MRQSPLPPKFAVMSQSRLSMLQELNLVARGKVEIPAMMQVLSGQLQEAACNIKHM